MEVLEKAIVTVLLVGGAVVAAAQQAPVFKSSADVIAVDVQVVSRDGMPITGLTAEQFEVFIDGRRRPVQSAQFLRVAEAPPLASKRGGAPPAPALAAPASGDGRIIMIAVDQMSFPMVTQQSAREAARRIASTVGPGDYLGMMTFPGDVRIAPTRDRTAVSEGITRIQGLRVEPNVLQTDLTVTEATLLRARDPATRDIIIRECRKHPEIKDCPIQVQQEAHTIVTHLEQQGLTSINGLHDVIDAMAQVKGRKILALVSAGIPLSNLVGGSPNLDHELARLSRRAAAADVTLYVFYMNVHFLRAFSVEYRRPTTTIYQDIGLFGYGLEKFADGAGGAFAQVEVDADPFVDRMLRETSAYYLLAVPTETRDRDDREHAIRVTVDARGASIQYRKAVRIPAK
jgi:VWFA-related protein